MNCCHEERQCADLARLEKLIKTHEQEVYRALLKQDKQIADLACKFNGDIQKAIYEYLLLMEKEGKLQEIITDTILNDVLVMEHKTTGIINIKEYGAIGDGFCDDTDAIQKAIDHAHDMGGGMVVIPASDGAFIFSTITVKEGVTLKGWGGVLKLKNSRCLDAAVSYYLIKNEGDNVSLVDLIIDGNAAHNHLYKVADAITVSGKNIRVTGCKIINPPDSGIMYSCVENSICSGNMISGARDCGIYINNNGKTDLEMGSTCEGNIIDGCYTGIAMKRVVQYMAVTGNIIKNCEYGITHENASADDDFSTDTIVSSNMIINTLNTAVILRGSKRCIVQGNYINGFNYCGIELQGAEQCTIEGNTMKAAITSTKRHAACVSLAPRAEADLVSQNNIVANNAFDVYFTHATYYFSFISIEDGNQNIVIGNNGKGTVNRGVTLVNTARNQIANNNLSGCEYSVVTNGNTDNLFQSNTIQGSDKLIYDPPIIGYTLFGASIYVNHTGSAPAFNANENDICLSKAPASNGCIGWIRTGGAWVPFAPVTA